MNEKREGGCLCGAVRYAISWPPLAQAVCHCRNCQKQAGSALSVIAVVPRDGLAVTGDLTVFKDGSASGRPVFRKFCGRCGSPIISDTADAEAQGFVFIKAGTLDDVSDLAPTVHYWTNSAQPWVAIPEGVTCIAEQ